MRLKGLIAGLSWTLGSSVSLVPAAQAWDGDLLCSMPDDQYAESLEGYGMSTMCEPGPAHLIRSSWFDDCTSASGREDSAADARAVAARAWSRGRTLEAEQRYDEALLNYRVLEAQLPILSDYARIMQADALDQLGDPQRALAAYRDVTAKSVQSDLVVRAQVGVVRSLIKLADKTAIKELDTLLARYPQLPEAPDLRLLAAEQREQAGDVQGAAAAYRALDLAMPTHPASAIARQHLERLISARLPPLTAEEQLTRAEHLFRAGDRDGARVELDLVMGPLARVPAKRREDLELRLLGRVVEASTDEEREAAGRSLDAKIKATRLNRLRPAQLLAMLDQAGRNQLSEQADALLGELMHRLAKVPAPMRFEALVSVTSVADDELVLSLAHTLYDDGKLGVAARYHGARALERLGKNEEALAELQKVIARDDSPTRFYANFAKQRVMALTDADHCDAPGRRTPCSAEKIDQRVDSLARRAGFDRDAAAALLEPLARDYGGAYPWLGRALELTRLGEVGYAADELYETYLAYRTATHRGPIRAGRASVLKGASTLHHLADLQTSRARASLPASARADIAEVARLLGDFGTTVVFGGPSLAETLPEAYAADVARVAKLYELDPDLLLAVMRVESVYQRRIISHAGAIGLMQIMPRTGRLIGARMGRYVAATDLLDPHQNLELAGWYLRALLDRMNGSLPLAIASYNGGPHNVRRWVESYGPHLPLDAFLERIPFTETKRYVRRVLGYYAKYRAARGEQLDRMAFILPSDRPEVVAF